MIKNILIVFLIALLFISPSYADNEIDQVFLKGVNSFGENRSVLADVYNENLILLKSSGISDGTQDTSDETGFSIAYDRNYFTGAGSESAYLNQAWHDVWYSDQSEVFFFVLIISLVISVILSIVHNKKEQNIRLYLETLEKVLIAGGHLSISVLLCFIAMGMIESSYYIFYISESGLFICLGLIFTLIYIASSSLLLFILTLFSGRIGYNYHFHACVAFLAGIFYTICLIYKNPVLFGMNLLYIPVLVALSFSLIVIAGFRRSSAETGSFCADEKTIVVGGMEKNSEITLFPPELSSNYSDISLAGMGGVAMVFKAKRVRDKKTVAIKIPIHSDETTGRSFIREIAVWKKLSHKNIVAIYSVNILPVPYIEMEYIERNLSDLTYPLSKEEALFIVSGIAEGLNYAHKNGIVHHDIKPKNILIDTDGTPKLTDWGLSRTAAENFESSNIGFSLVYAAPEQIFPSRYGKPGEGTDIYQTGLIFYQILTGKKPVSGDVIEEFSKDDPKNEITPVSVLFNDESFLEFDRIIMHCLEKEPGLRYPHMQKLLCDIKELSDRNSQNSL